MDDHRPESDICSYLSELRDDPRNHAVTLIKRENIRDTGGELLLLKDGGTALDCYSFAGDMNAGKLLDIGRQYFEGIDFLHQNGIQHNDLKPSNAVVDESGRLVLIDFGLATYCRCYGEEAISDGAEFDGTFVGTEGWTAPEVGRGEPYSAKRADMWAAGKVIYELCNSLAFASCDEPTERGMELLTDLCTELMNTNPERRPPLETVVARITSYMK